LKTELGVKMGASDTEICQSRAHCWCRTIAVFHVWLFERFARSCLSRSYMLDKRSTI